MSKTFKLNLLLIGLTLVSCSSRKDISNNIRTNLETGNSDTSESYHQIKPVAKRYDRYDQFCYLKCPEINYDKNILINHEDYLINYNIDTKYADWVAYKINKRNLSGMNKARFWRPDPKLPKKIAMVPADYRGAAQVCNYDRGHQAPLADFSRSVSWESVNYLSNITPQKADLNRGPWYYLESEIRRLGKITSGQLYILTGPYYTDKIMCKLPYAHIENRVPNGYWKIITLVKGEDILRASFRFDQHTARNINFCKHLTTVKEIEKLTKLKFQDSKYIENSDELLKIMNCKNEQAFSR